MRCLKGLRHDIFISHDWPSNVAPHGDLPTLLRKKKFLASEIADGSLGSPSGRRIMDDLRPAHWLSAHLHVKYEATIRHPTKAAPAAAGPDSDDGKAQNTKFTAAEGDCGAAASFEEQVRSRGVVLR